MSLWKRILSVLGKRNAAARGPEASEPKARKRPAPAPPTLAEMRSKLRAGMSSDEFFSVLDEIVIERGLRLSMPSNSKSLIALPVAEGGELLCFLTDGVLSYVEYEGDIFLER